MASLKPVGCTATAAKIFQVLSGMEQTLVILVAATGVRISEAMGSKWDHIDYHINQSTCVGSGSRTWSLERLKTDDSAAPLPVSDLLADCLRSWQREKVYARPDGLDLREHEKQGAEAQIEQRTDLGSSSSRGNRRRAEAEKGATVWLPQLPSWTGKLAGEPGGGRENGPESSSPLKRQAIRSGTQTVQ